MTGIAARFSLVSVVTVAAALSLAACASGGAGSTPDARIVGNIDAAGTVDAARGIDAGESIDAGETVDATAADASSAGDAASSIDAVPGPDAGPSDAGAVAELVINEAVLDMDGIDTAEFIEIKGAASTDYSAYTVVQLDGDEGGEPGKIISIHPVGTTDASGYWQTGPMNNKLQNGTQTLILVKDFTGTVGMDLDTNDDGSFDATPWSAAIDAFAVRDGNGTTPGGAADIHYSGAAFLDKGGDSRIGGASRIPDGTDTDTAADWTWNAFNGTAADSSEANDTPGAPNTVGI